MAAALDGGVAGPGRAAMDSGRGGSPLPVRGVAATGGTFDVIHDGHRALLCEALRYDFTILGLCTDAFVERRGKSIRNSYGARRRNLADFINGQFPGSSFGIYELEDDFGPAALRPEVGFLVASEETAGSGERLNEMRAGWGLPPVRVVVVPMVLGYDGERISSTRMREGVVDSAGKKLLSSG